MGLRATNGWSQGVHDFLKKELLLPRVLYPKASQAFFAALNFAQRNF